MTFISWAILEKSTADDSCPACKDSLESVFYLQLPDNLTMEELELQKESVSIGTPGRYFAINELDFFLETMSWSDRLQDTLP